ncbi:MAG: hypothetical protein ACT4P2_04580 [Pseudomonadota bacterium]
MPSARKRAASATSTPPVLAIAAFLDVGRDRIFYADIDGHHCDGVAEAFAGDPRVFMVSVHEAGRWPGTGALAERAGGNARNLPVPAGFNDSEMALVIDEAFLPLAARLRPAATVVCCGADALADDPLTGLALSNCALWRAVGSLAATSPSVVVVGGGGYNPWAVARCWTGVWATLNRFAIPPTVCRPRPRRSCAPSPGISTTARRGPRHGSPPSPTRRAREPCARTSNAPLAPRWRPERDANGGAARITSVSDGHAV